VQILADKVRAAGAQKGILFATNGFQRGALEYAQVHGIALVRLVDGALTYETADPSAGPRPAPPPWANIQPFVGQLVTLGDGGSSMHVSVVDRANADCQRDFMTF
jgi:restriction system protein